MITLLDSQLDFFPILKPRAPVISFRRGRPAVSECAVEVVLGRRSAHSVALSARSSCLSIFFSQRLIANGFGQVLAR